MLQIKEWRPTKEAQLECGHRIKPGEIGYTITLFICPQEAVCLFLAVKTSLLAFRELAAQQWKPTLFQRLKSNWFETKEEKERPA